MSKSEPVKPAHFIRQIISKDLDSGKNDGRVATRFPPEPNGYLHVGHAKSICLNFSMAEEFGGTCNLRFDDTNPEKESQEYIEAIKRDVTWLGFEWHADVRYASDYFDRLYEFAVELIKQHKAYVDESTPEQIRAMRGTLTEPGQDSPYRSRTVEENLQQFERMRAGEFADGSAVLRARIDMASPNINMRDPVIYRVRRAHHHQTGDKWCVYPMYDYTHCLSDALEEITHSLCTLEFEDHRPLYDWVLDQLDVPCHPQQIEFARLNLNYTVTSKRKLKQLVDEHHVSGWDDPRMPTIAGMRRRGYTPASIRNFCEMIGVTKSEGVVDVSMLEFAIRDDLDKHAPRAMCVMHPLKVVITNWNQVAEQSLTIPAHPKDETLGSREIFFGNTLYIDRSDFEEEPPKGFKRLIPGGEVRLRGAYVIRCDEVIKNEQGEVVELRCSYDDQTLGKNPEGRKVKGVVHWVSAAKALPVEVRLYDRLFNHESPDAAKDGTDFVDHINPDSLTVITTAMAEPSLQNAKAELPYQFEREGYFVLDSEDATADKLVFNRTVTLRDTWAKSQK
ncbi:MAG: glutamine--tRNA ligase [Pseudomonadales bacterium]|mgnify:FL=1|jgi:glutaminyl-tRNA synthetase|nr:glutamine--tRNA ligase [Pseudomonadales bacterium]MAQ25697.1 glutamine--tRNA ligase [Pseudomonadales bacterium]MEC8809900.1 glutamine--tRNA ligase/YqeY domain fusion protein [Pseudomonadota bacterium]HAG95018.1 glutamine--tRNA ligase [Gammaproteobacteria bacterium]HAU13522.1 glutamine--tRNA ligase [Gammaproteobacteria bacterium]|tara:strand:- start:43641 stop:45323 length:1683 start_codon:yes stop_codon:yes gene_type:complete